MAVKVAVHVLYGVVALLVLLPGVLGANAGGLARRALRHPWLAWVGLVSYAFYLYHTIVIQQLNKFALDSHIALRYVFVFVFGICHLMRLCRRELLRFRAPHHAAAWLATAAWPDRAQRGSQVR